MAQLPTNRRLHPTALRKDHWVPLLKATFKDPATMRQVYARLHEYRQWRAKEPVPMERRAMTTKARRQLEINQVATSIADLAASCTTFSETAPVTIKWFNEEEKVHAKEWPLTVTHTPGLTIERGFAVIEQDDAAATTNDSSVASETQESTAQATP